MSYLYLYHNALRRSGSKTSNNKMLWAKSNKLSSKECGRRRLCLNYIFSFLYEENPRKLRIIIGDLQIYIFGLLHHINSISGNNC